MRQKIPSGKSLTSVDIVFNSSEILTLNPITDSWVMTVQVVCNTVVVLTDSPGWASVFWQYGKHYTVLFKLFAMDLCMTRKMTFLVILEPQVSRSSSDQFCKLQDAHLKFYFSPWSSSNHLPLVKMLKLNIIIFRIFLVIILEWFLHGGNTRILSRVKMKFVINIRYFKIKYIIYNLTLNYIIL